MVRYTVVITIIPVIITAQTVKIDSSIQNLLANADSKRTIPVWIFLVDVGKNGTIRKTTTAVETYVIHTFSSEADSPVQLMLFQNYPNPFNESTVIRFS